MADLIKIKFQKATLIKDKIKVDQYFKAKLIVKKEIKKNDKFLQSLIFIISGMNFFFIIFQFFLFIVVIYN